MDVFWIGAMPWVKLYDGGSLAGWASIARTDWSPHGTGIQLKVLHGGRLRVLGTNRGLHAWLEDWYYRVNGAADGGAWRPEPFEPCEIAFDVDPDRGLTARGGDVEVEFSEPLSRHLIRRERYPLGEFAPTASWVRVSCRRARIVVGGRELRGVPSMGADRFGTMSSAQINVAEVWAV